MTFNDQYYTMIVCEECAQVVFFFTEALQHKLKSVGELRGHCQFCGTEIAIFHDPTAERGLMVAQISPLRTMDEAD